MRTAKRIIKWAIWTVITAYIAAVAIVHLPAVQEWIGSRVAKAVMQKLDTKVQIGRIYLGLPNRIVIDDLRLYDKQGRLMIRAGRAAAKVDYGEMVRNGRICVSSAQLFSMKAVFYKERGKTEPNFKFVLDSLASKDKTKKSDLQLSVNSLIIRHGAVSYDDYGRKAAGTGTFDPAHLGIEDISAHVVLPYYTPDSLSVAVKKLSLREKSGLDLRRLAFNLKIAKNGGQAQCLLTNLNAELPASDMEIEDLHAECDVTNGKADLNTLRYGGRLKCMKLSPRDLSWAIPQLKNVTTGMSISSSFNGTGRSVNVSVLNISAYDGGIALSADGNATWEAPDLRWRTNIRSLRCSEEGIKTVAYELGAKGAMPETLKRLGDIRFSGYVAGRGNSLETDGELASGIGNADIRLNMTDNHMSAYVSTDGVDVGKLADNEEIGIIAANANVSADRTQKGLTNINVNGDFPRIDFKGYSYTNIKAHGGYHNNVLDGSLSVDDPNGQISISGTADISKAVQSTDIHATIRNLDLAALKITDKWKDAKFDLDISADTKISDAEANLFRGDIGIRNFRMVSAEEEYQLDSLTLTASPDRLIMLSDFGTAELTGHYRLRTVAQSFANLLHSKLPSFFDAVPRSANKFNLKAQINKSDWLNRIFGIPLDIKSPLNVTAHLDDTQGMLRLACSAGKMTYDGNPYEDISVTAGTFGDTLSVNGKVKKVMGNGHKLDLDLLADAYDDILATSIHWDNNRRKPMTGTLNAETKFHRHENGKTDVDINVKPSQILVNDTAWNVLPANILYSNGDLAIDHFSIEHNRQHIRIDGKATKHSTDSITVDLQDVDVSYVLNLVNFHSVEFSGHMTGKAHVKSVFYEPDAYADLTVNNFLFEQGRLGKLFANVRWNKEEKQIDINAHADDKDARTIITGYVSPAHNHIDLGITAENTNIEFLESFCGAFMNDIKGTANGKVRVHGPLNAINMTGQLVADGSALITPTNVTYNLVNDTIRFLPDNIVFRADTIRDRNGNIGIVNGALHHKNLSNLTYDISISTNNLLCYDTHGYGEDSFYGTAYGTGTCNIQGGNGRVDIDIDITPEENSFIEYNAASPEAISDQQFITWRDKCGLAEAADDTTGNAGMATTAEEDVLPADIPSDMRINFLVNMTPKATLRVLMDKNTNDYIALNGNGTLRASYFNKGSFDMFGTFLIDHGVYTLTIQNIIKKVFQFQQGGTIVFGGDPYDALLDLQAIYTVNGVPLSDLQLGNSFSSNNVRVDCFMNISGTPQSPHVDFNIDMPTVSDDAEQMVRTVINSEEEMNQQVVYLLGVGRFYIQGNNNSSNQGQPNQTSLAMQSLLSGTISQQINTILGSLVKNNNWTFGANISTGDEGFNNAEYEGLLSGRLLNNRLIINGQFGYRDNENATTSFIGDFDINYLLLPNGNIALKVYNQTNDRYFTKSSLNTQGIGLILKKDFNSLMELFGFKRKSK